MKFIVKEECLLLDYLYKNIKNKSKNNIKTLLKNGVYVNKQLTKKYDYILKSGDEISIILNKIGNDKYQIDIIYENNEFIVVNKPYGLLTVSTLKEKEKTLYHFVLEYLKKKNQKVFVIHRLDKETSGLVMFAKNEKIKTLFQNNWNEIVRVRKYYALVEGNMLNKEGTFKSYLIEDKNHMVHSSKKGKLAVTKYKVIKSNEKYSLVEIEILTGRKNQIRVQFNEAGHSIVGDSKYGSKNKKINRMCLHASALEFKYPTNKSTYKFDISMPDLFIKLIGGVKK